MKTIEGFVKVTSLINNIPGTISPIGELSTQSLTYAQDIQEYKNNSYLGQYNLLVFSSLDLTTNSYTTPNTSVINTVIELVADAITYSANNIQPFNSTNWLTYINGLLNTRITSLAIGNFISSGNVALPEWFSFSSLEDTMATVKIWLSDTSFKTQYDKYTVIPSLPFTHIDDFFTLTYAALQTNVTALTPSALLTNTLLAQNNKPATDIVINNFNYISPVNTNPPISVPWYNSVYGTKGSTIEVLKATITAAILANSTHTRNEWVGIFPDLFKQTEFILIPRWDLIAVPNLTVQTGLYSPISTPSAAISHFTGLVPSYPSIHINSNLQVITSIYKYLNIEVVGGTDNINSDFTISSVFPDYMPIDTTSLDFNRMTTNTQNWSILLEQLLIAAESTIGSYSLLINMRSVTRDNKLYISAIYNNIEYLVYARSN